MPEETKRRGRPPGTGHGRLGQVRRIRIPDAVYDVLCRISRRDRLSIHALLVRAAAREAQLSGSHNNS